MVTREPSGTTLSFSRISEDKMVVIIDIVVHLASQAKYDQPVENRFYFAAVLDAMWVVVSTMIVICVQGKLFHQLPHSHSRGSSAEWIKYGMQALLPLTDRILPSVVAGLDEANQDASAASGDTAARRQSVMHHREQGSAVNYVSNAGAPAST